MTRISNERLSQMLDPARPADWPAVEEQQVLVAEVQSGRGVIDDLHESVQDLRTWVDRTGSAGRPSLVIPRVHGSTSHGFISLDRVIEQIRPFLEAHLAQFPADE
jgi:hypothetical protein